MSSSATTLDSAPQNPKPWSWNWLRSKYTYASIVGAIGGVVCPILAAISPYIAIGAVAGLAVTYFSVAYPIFSVLMTALVVPVERLGRFSNDSQAITISLMRIFGMLGLLSLGLNWLLKKKKIQIYKPVAIYGLFILYCFISLAWASGESKALSSAITMLGNFLFLVLVTNVVRDRSQLKLPIILWLITTVAIGAFTIYQWGDPTAIAKEDRFKNSGEMTTDQRFTTVMMDYAEFEQIGAVKRAIGATSHPAVYGINIILAIPFFLYLMRASSSWITWGLCILGFGVSAYNAMLTNTRAVMMTLVFSLVVAAIIGLIRIRPITIVLGIFLSIAMIPFIPESLYSRILDPSNYSTDKAHALRVRFTYWETGIDIFQDHWLLGLGVGDQIELVKRLKPKMNMPSNTSIHNEYIQSLIESGLVGYPLIVAFMVLAYRRSKAAERYFGSINDTPTEMFLKAVRVNYIVLLFYALQCDVLHFTIKGWWLTMAMAISLSEIAIQSIRSTEQGSQGTQNA